MKLLFLAVSVLLCTGGVCRAQSDTPVFPDLPSLRAWAAKIDHGGARVDVVRAKDREAVIVRSSHGSGLPSCELWVFVQSREAWRLGFHLGRHQGDWFEFVQKDDEVVVTLWEKKKEIARFSIAGLKAP